MVDDLLWDHELVGMTSADIENLLGPKDEMGYFESYDFVYWLGPERGFLSIDSEWLVLSVNEKGRVSRYEIVTD